MRIAAIEVSHWHALHDAAYLKNAVTLPNVELVAIQDPSAEIAAQRAAALGGPSVYTDYRTMLHETRPDFVIALGRHSAMASIAHHLLDEGYPFLMEKPMGLNADEVRPSRTRPPRSARSSRCAWRSAISRSHSRAAAPGRGPVGPLSHVYVRLNRPTSARYPAWGSPWMLDPAIAGGGCLRNLGTHVMDLFLLLTGEDARVTGAQLSHRALGQPVEDYASVLLRSSGGVLGTVEIGNTVPRDGTDGEWKVAGRDAIFSMRDDVLHLVTAAGEETASGQPTEPLYLTALRDVLDRFGAARRRRPASPTWRARSS